jgi:urease accessory protein UreE
LGCLFRLSWALGNFHTACFASATGLNLRLDYNYSANLGGCCLCFFWGVCDESL